MANSELVRAAIEHAQRIAPRFFAGSPDFDDNVADTLSYAWEGAIAAGPEATFRSVVWYAIERAGSARAMGLSVRSIEHPRNRPQHDRFAEDVSQLSGLFRDGDDPAAIVQVRLDYAAWIASLSKRDASIASMMAIGESTRNIAKVFRVSPGRISQLRRELLADWNEFTD